MCDKNIYSKLFLYVKMLSYHRVTAPSINFMDRYFPIYPFQLPFCSALIYREVLLKLSRMIMSDYE